MANTRSFTGLEARRLLRRARTGTMATLNRDDGIPYASLANVATDAAGHPLIMVSTLAWHTRNLLADPRASLMVAETPEAGDALTGARISVMGHFEKIEAERAGRRYLARHPEAAMYAGFADFGFWRLVPRRIHAVAGFGRIETLDAGEVFPPAEVMADLEDSAIAHMNQDHADTVQRYATGLGGAVHGKWKVAALDADGMDLTDGAQSLRLEFPEPVSKGEDLRKMLAELARGNPK
jgi:heme iron utilization protein